MGAVTSTPREFADLEDLYSGSVFPRREFFAGCETALCLFTAEWLGRQDVYWIAKQGIVGTCVDLNGDKLRQMQELYPDGWEFIEADVYEYAASAHNTWDVVTLDPWTGQFARCADLLPLWTTLARKVVVLGHGNYRLERPEAPEGWSMVEVIRRGDFKGGVYWLVFTRDDPADE